MIKTNLARIRQAFSRVNLNKRLGSPFSSKDPVFIFHHMPKCGGTSLSQVLNKWFIVVRDYRKDWASVHPKKIDLNKLRSIHCLSGHWELPGTYLVERYPEVFSNTRYKLFTFLREPLRHSLSLYRYERENNQTDIVEIKEHFSIRPNYMATILNANKENYKEIMNKYFFIGIVEEMEKSVKILAQLIEKKYSPLPWINKTKSVKSAELENLDKTDIELFKKNNELDYLIYNYANEKLQRYS